jgi:radical SAM protein with 4Fe4S-binding SPASM domain
VTVGADNLHGVPALTDWLRAREMGFRYSLVRDLDGGAGLLESRLPGWRPGGGLLQLRRPRGPSAEAPPMLEGEGLARVLRVFAECYDRIERAMPVRPSFRRTHRFCDLQWRHPIGRACAAGERSLAIAHDGRVSACQAALHHEGAAALSGHDALLALAPSIMGPTFQKRTAEPECQGCRFRHSCAGGCPLLLHRRDGHADGRSPYCEVFRAVLPRILRIAALELLLEARPQAG